MASQLEPETSGKHGIFPRGSVMDFFFIFFFFFPPSPVSSVWLLGGRKAAVSLISS